MSIIFELKYNNNLGEFQKPGTGGKVDRGANDPKPDYHYRENLRSSDFQQSSIKPRKYCQHTIIKVGLNEFVCHTDQRIMPLLTRLALNRRNRDLTGCYLS